MPKKQHLITLDSVKESDGTAKAWYFSTDNYISANNYVAKVVQPGLFKQLMFTEGATSGSSQGGYGEIEILDTDGALGEMLDYAFDGRNCIVSEGNKGQSLSFSTVITGTIEQVVFEWNKSKLRLKDRSLLLKVPIQPNRYLGNNSLPNGLEGLTDLKNKPKPLLYGVGNNLTVPCVNTSRLIYQVNDGAVNTVSVVYDGGNALTKGADYTSQADMETNAPAANSFRVWPGGGYIRLGTSPVGAITCDAIQGAFASSRTSAQIIKTIVVGKLGSGSCVEQTILDLDTDAPYVVGIYTGTSDITADAVIDMLCGSVGAWWGFDNFGKFWCKQLKAPVASQAIATITNDNIKTIQRLATSDDGRGVPAYKVNVDYDKNWTVQTDGVATIVTATRRDYLANEYRRVAVTNATVQSRHLNSPELFVKTLLTNSTDAATEANRILNLRSVRRDRLKIGIELQSLQYPQNGYWDDEAISNTTLNGISTICEFSSGVVFGNYLYLLGGSWNLVAAAHSLRLDLTNPTGAWDNAGVTDLPISLYGHSSVVFGNYVYVFGGWNGSSMSAKTYRLDLTNPTGAWDDAGVTDLPSGRAYGQAIVYGNYVYYLGGTNGTYFSTVLKLDLTNPTGAWDDAGVTDLPIAISQFAATVLGNCVYVTGGYNSSLGASAKTYRLDLTNPTGAWDDAGVPDLPDGLFSHSMTTMGNKLLILGGYLANYTNQALTLDTTKLASWDASDVAPMPDARNNAVVWNASGSIFIATGRTAANATPSARLYRTNNNANDRARLYDLGRTLNVKLPRYGYSAGRPMRIIGTEVDYAKQNLTLDLWG